MPSFHYYSGRFGVPSNLNSTILLYVVSPTLCLLTLTSRVPWLEIYNLQALFWFDS